MVYGAFDASLARMPPPASLSHTALWHDVFIQNIHLFCTFVNTVIIHINNEAISNYFAILVISANFSKEGCGGCYILKCSQYINIVNRKLDHTQCHTFPLQDRRKLFQCSYGSNDSFGHTIGAILQIRFQF